MICVDAANVDSGNAKKQEIGARCNRGQPGGVSSSQVERERRAHTFGCWVEVKMANARPRRSVDLYILYVKKGSDARPEVLIDPNSWSADHSVLVEAAREPRSKARVRRSEEQREQDRLRTLITLGPAVSSTTIAVPNNESPHLCSPAANVALDPLTVPAAIQSIRRQVCEHFYLGEMRDPELIVRTNRRACVLPRQIAMYIARQLIGRRSRRSAASLAAGTTPPCCTP